MSVIRRVGATGKDFLLTILNSATSTPGDAWVYLKGGPGAKEYYERRQQEFALARLKKQRLIRERKRGDRVMIELTEEGKTYAIKQKIIVAKKILPINKACLVSFDFPERQRRARQTFRLFLQEAGFVKRHDSTWISPMDVASEIRLLINKLKIGDWVDVYVVERR